MSDVFQADYDQLSKVAGHFDEVSQFVNSLIQKVEDQQQILRSGGWVANAADRFYQSMDGDVRPGLDRLRLALDTAGTVLNEISHKVQAADEEACACIPHGE